MAGIDRDKLRPMLKIPNNYEIPLLLSLGYPDETSVDEPFEGSIKYWKDENGVMHVPKKSLESLVHRNSF